MLEDSLTVKYTESGLTHQTFFGMTMTKSLGWVFATHNSFVNLLWLSYTTAYQMLSFLYFKFMQKSIYIPHSAN